ncbi:MAG TPA: hypothetical protein VN743_06745, partial [Blastocatellia bacterium]|nr:hypothetical protein [Blastocatellia bacterium]
MKRITHFSAVLAVGLMLALAGTSIVATKSGRAGKYLTVEGKVLAVNTHDRTLLVSDTWSNTLYLVSVPAGKSVRITFGLNMHSAEPQFRDVHQNDRVRLRCARIQDRLAQLNDDHRVVTVTAVN